MFYNQKGTVISQAKEGLRKTAAFFLLGSLALSMGIPSAAAQELRTFRWESPKTVCDDGQPGSDRLLFENGAYRISTDQFARRCKLRMVWTRSVFRTSFNVSQEAVLQRRGEVVTPTGQRLSFLGSFRDGNTVASEIFLSRLPAGTFRAGLRIRRANGEVHTANPAFYAFGRGGETVSEPPRITSFRINGGAASTSNAVLRLDLRTTGAQPTQIMIGERPGPGFRGARWQYYRPTTGAGGGRQTYTLQGRTSGRKTIHVKVRAGGVESESVFDSIDYVHVTSHQADQLQVLQFAEDNGFRHSAEVLSPLATQGRSPKCAVVDGGFDVYGPVGTRCRFRLFEGRLLNEGWTVEDIRPLIDRSVIRLRIQRPARGRSAQMEFTLERLKNSKNDPYNIGEEPGIRVRLRGPAEQEWQDAFRR